MKAENMASRHRYGEELEACPEWVSRLVIGLSVLVVVLALWGRA